MLHEADKGSISRQPIWFSEYVVGSSDHRARSKLQALPGVAAKPK